MSATLEDLRGAHEAVAELRRGQIPDASRESLQALREARGEAMPTENNPRPRKLPALVTLITRYVDGLLVDSGLGDLVPGQGGGRRGPDDQTIAASARRARRRLWARAVERTGAQQRAARKAGTNLRNPPDHGGERGACRHTDPSRNRTRIEPPRPSPLRGAREADARICQYRRALTAEVCCHHRERTSRIRP